MKYVHDPIMDSSPFRYSREQISRSYLYNHGGFRPDYVHFGVFLDQIPVGSLQLKRMDRQKHSCEFGIILQNDDVKNRMEIMTGETMGRNKRMIRVFEKLGFERVETVPDAFELPDGQKEDRLIYRKYLTEG